MQEIELEILEINEAEIRKKLDSFADKISDSLLLTTIYFNNPYNDATVRARLINSQATFTVKVKVPDKEFKIRKEYETKIENFSIFKKQLGILGFAQDKLQEKKRTTYKYKNSEIVIDKYPKIPSYIEIEGPKEEIKEVLNKMGYTMEDASRISVPGLLKKYRIAEKELRFKDNIQ